MNLLRILLLLLLSSPLLKAQGWLRFPPDTVQSYSHKEGASYTGSAFINDKIYVAIKLRKWDILQQDHTLADYKELEIEVPTGIYFLRIQEGNNQKTFRLLFAD